MRIVYFTFLTAYVVYPIRTETTTTLLCPCKTVDIGKNGTKYVIRSLKKLRHVALMSFKTKRVSSFDLTFLS